MTLRGTATLRARAAAMLVRARAAAMLVVAGAALAGCGYIGFEALQPSRPAGPPVDTPPPPPSRLVDVQLAIVDTVESLEVGTTRTGLLLAAFGTAPRTGWFQPALRPLNNGLPTPDGFLEYEFVAAPPELNGGEEQPPGTPAQRRLEAVRPIPQLALSSAAGIRVFAARGTPAALRFAPAAPAEAAPDRGRPARPAASPSGPTLPTTGG